MWAGLDGGGAKALWHGCARRLTLFFKDAATARDVNKAQIYVWRKGIKTLLLHPASPDGAGGNRGRGLRQLHALGRQHLLTHVGRGPPL